MKAIVKRNGISFVTQITGTKEEIEKELKRKFQIEYIFRNKREIITNFTTIYHIYSVDWIDCEPVDQTQELIKKHNEAINR